MSKATHTGRLKSAKYIANKFDRSEISKEFALYLIENEGQIRELKQFGNCDTRYFDGDIGVVSSYFTDLKPIKPVIEIPSGDFWVLEPQEHEFIEVKELIFGKFRVGDDFVSRDVLKYNINNGIWTICEEPKKEMRPWNDEEWKEWFLNDGVYMLKGKSLYRASGISSTKMIVLADMDDYDPRNPCGEEILDRHGNKFEKVVE